MYHISERPIKKLKDVPSKYNQKPSWKPVGFWYAQGMSWLKFVRDEMPRERGCCYLYKVHLDPKLKILRINTLKKYTKFVEQYPAYKEFVRGRSDEDYDKILPNWGKLSKEYDGFEIIIPNFQKLKMKYFGLGIFDIPSGCLWRPRNTKLTLVKQYKTYLINAYLYLDRPNYDYDLFKFVNSKEYQNEIGEWDSMQGINSKKYLKDSRISFMYDQAVKDMPFIGTAKIVALPKKGFAELINVFIFKKFRGKGFCKQLVSTTVTKYKEEFPDTKILLMVAKENTSAIKCYQKVGFKNYNSAVAIWLIKRFCKKYPELSKKYTFQVMAI